MPESVLTLTLKADSRPGYYVLICGDTKASIEIRPSITFSDLLRRLPSVLGGEQDSAGQLSPLELVHEVGTRLWQQLLPDTLPTAIYEALALQLCSATTTLLLTLPSELAWLPWELLCDPHSLDDTGFLARRRPLVRYFSSNTTLTPLKPPLKVLLLLSSPPRMEDDRWLDVESERAAIEDAVKEFRAQGMLHLLVEDCVTVRRVQQDLMRFRPHIVHYIGHGLYEEGIGGSLVWEDEQGNPWEMPDTRLAELLRRRGLRMVVLHGCQTAKSDPFHLIQSMAQRLLETGIPAVLAQQANFTYESSQRASEAFLQH